MAFVGTLSAYCTRLLMQRPGVLAAVDFKSLTREDAYVADTPR